jgi:adenylate cyclase
MPDDSAPAGAPDLERKLLTILSADVAEYSRLMAGNEEETLRVFREHKQVFDSLVTLHCGRIFNTAGHAILAEFTSAVEAVRCATEIQAALRTRNDLMPPARQVRFRIGVNLGDVMVHGSDLMGDGVNVAARLQGAAEPGGVCVSGSVYDQIRNKLSLSFKPLGEQSFKNIPQPVRTFAISEAEGIGVLPAPDTHGRRRGHGHRWIAAAAIVLIALGGGWWIWAENERARVEQTRLAAAAETAKQEAAKREAEVLALRQAAEEEARRRAEAERQAAERRAAERQAAEAARREAELATQRAAA